MGGFNLACAAVEALTRSLAGELGAVYLASEDAGAMTGTMANLSCGAIID